MDVIMCRPRIVTYFEQLELKCYEIVTYFEQLELNRCK